MAAFNFTPGQDKRLVKAVKENRVLYDTTSSKHRQFSVRYKIWTDIASKLDKSAEECRLRWKNIRDSYNRYKRRSQSDPQSYKSHKLCKWKFFDQLSFLDDQSGETTEQPAEEKNEEWSSDEDSAPSSPSPTVDYEQNDDIDVKVNIVNPLEGASPMKEKTGFERENNMIVVDASFDPDERVPENDDDHSFSMHIKCVLKKMPPRLKIMAKNELFATLSKFETMNLNIQEHGSTS